MACTTAATLPAYAVCRPRPVSGPTHLSTEWGLGPPCHSGCSLSCSQSMEGGPGSSAVDEMAPAAAMAEEEAPAMPPRGAPPSDRDGSLGTVGTPAPASWLPGSQMPPGTAGTWFSGSAGTSPCCCFRSFSQHDWVAMIPGDRRREREAEDAAWLELELELEDCGRWAGPSGVSASDWRALGHVILSSLSTAT